MGGDSFFLARRRLRHDGRAVAEGEILWLSPKAAAPLLGIGAVAPAAAPAPGHPARSAVLAAILCGLPRGKKGEPDAGALAAAAGFEPTAEELAALKGEGA